MASSSSSSGRLPLQRALQNLRMECETGGQQRLQSQLNGKSIEELRKLCIAAGVSRHEIHDRELFEVDPVPTGCATISDNRQNNMS